MTSEISDVLATAECEPLPEAEIAQLAKGTPLQRALFSAYADGDVTPFLAAMEAAFFPMRFSDRFGDYVRATLRIASINGPFRLEGVARAVTRLGPPISGDPFPGLVVGGDGAGTAFVLIPTTGRVVTLHHDATYFEVADDVTRTFPHKHERIRWFSSRGAALSIAELTRFQVGAHAMGLEALPASKRRRAAGALLGELASLGLARHASTLLNRPPMEFMRARFRPTLAGIKQGIANRTGLPPPTPPHYWVEDALRAPETPYIKIKRRRDLAHLSAFENIQSLRVQKPLKLRTIPDEILACETLEELSIRDSGLESMDGIGALRHLKYLDLSVNAITAVPAALGELRNLLEINLGSNPITSVPAGLSALTELYWLTLECTSITELPASFAALKHLTTLNMAGNDLDEAARAAIRRLLPNSDISF